MRTPRETFETGTALYRDLEALLGAERAVLAGPDAGAIDRANARRQALLADIAAWEEEAGALVAAGPKSLSDVVACLPDAERPAAEAALGCLADAAQAARHQAAVSHVVVERSLEAVGRTIDVLTGTPTDATYGRAGSMARGARRGLVERAG